MEMDEVTARALQDIGDSGLDPKTRSVVHEVRKKMGEGKFVLEMNAGQAMIMLETQAIGIQSDATTQKMTALTVLVDISDWKALQDKMIALNEQLDETRKSLDDVMKDFKQQTESAAEAPQVS